MNQFSFPSSCRSAMAFGLGLCAMASAGAAAPIWTFGGFGSLGVVHSSERQADYSANVVNPGGAGYSDRWSMSVDSRLGAQLGLTFDPQWSAVLQVIAERNLQEAKILLKHSNWNISEISYVLGFEDSANFSHFFLGCIGKTLIRQRCNTKNQ